MPQYTALVHLNHNILIKVNYWMSIQKESIVIFIKN